jgi:ligand-binding sensor domain-containing protein
MRKLLLLVLVFFFWQNFTICRHTIKFNYLSTQDGLSSNRTTCVFKDSKGYIWIGTRNGLNRYNAYEFEVWKHIPGDTSGITNNHITCFGEDNAGKIWIGTYSGISIYN